MRNRFQWPPQVDRPWSLLPIKRRRFRPRVPGRWLLPIVTGVTYCVQVLR